MRRSALALVVVLFAAGLVSFTARPAAAAPVGFTQSTIAQQDRIYSIDMATGAMTLVGPTGLPPATRGLTLGPDGTLYGANGGSLYTFSTSTGAATLVGSFGCCSIVEDMTFDAAGNLWLLSNNPSNLFAVDLVTGAATLVGPLGRGLMTGLAGSCDGTVYGTDNVDDVLVRIDTATAGTQVVGPFGTDVGSGSLAHDGAGQLWMLLRPAAPAGAPSQSRMVDAGTGATTPVATVVGNNPGDVALGPLACSSAGTTTSDPTDPTDPTVPVTDPTLPAVEPTLAVGVPTTPTTAAVAVAASAVPLVAPAFAG